MEGFMHLFRNIYDFFSDGIWKVRFSELSGKQKFLFLPARMIVLAAKGFTKNRCILRASSLTYFSLLSIVPVFALAFGLAKSFNLQQMLEKQLRSALEGNEAILKRILEFSNNQLQAAQGKVIAGLGVILLFWTIVKLLSNVEAAFNDIWGVQQNRSFFRKIADYIILVGITPFFLGISGSVTAFLSSQPEYLMQEWHMLSYFGPFFLIWIKFLPLLILVPFFSFLYIFLPNTTVKIKAGIAGGFVAALAFIYWQSFYIWAQVSLFTKYNAIYGSFASFPMFLVWLEVSWMILLIGAEIAFATQNVETFEFEKESGSASHDLINLLSVYITSVIVERFENEEPPISMDEIRYKLKMPYLLVERLIHNLKRAGIIEPVKISDTGRNEAYRPALPTDKLTIMFILDRLDSLGLDELPYEKNEKYSTISESLEEFKKLCTKSKANVRLSQMVVLSEK